MCTIEISYAFIENKNNKHICEVHIIIFIKILVNNINIKLNLKKNRLSGRHHILKYAIVYVFNNNNTYNNRFTIPSRVL